MVAPTTGQLGKQLLHRYFKDLQQVNRGPRKFLSPAFQVQRGDGTRQTKAELVNNPPKVGPYTLPGPDVTSGGRARVTSPEAPTT